MLIAAAAPPAIDRAARLGDGWLASPGLTPAEARAQLSQYLYACDAHQRPPGVLAIRRDIHVGADVVDARRVAAAILADLGDAGFTDVIVRHLAEDQHDVLASFDRLSSVRRLVAS